jgi:hypothetical protein
VLAELERNRVFDRGEKGELVSRRMVRDRPKAMRYRENGRKGGNAGVNPPVKAQIPEARYQKYQKSEFSISIMMLIAQ